MDEIPIAKPGGVYSCDNGNGTFAIAKVLVIEDGMVHVCLYGNAFNHRPASIDPATLDVAAAHVPVPEAGFRSWNPGLLFEQPVTEEDLIGYRFR